MYERFTDRARKAMQLANSEACRLNHEHVGTEHILLGLIKEGAGVAAIVLRKLGIDLQTVRIEVEKIVLRGPDMIVMGTLPQTPRAKKVIEYAYAEVVTLNHHYVGTEHLLLGLIHEHEGVSAQVLMNLGLTIDSVRNETLRQLGHDTGSASDGTLSAVDELKSELRESLIATLTCFDELLDFWSNPEYQGEKKDLNATLSQRNSIAEMLGFLPRQASV